jgi:hypothetical protein
MKTAGKVKELKKYKNLNGPSNRCLRGLKKKFIIFSSVASSLSQKSDGK